METTQPNRGEIPIADQDVRYHGLNTIGSKLLAIAALIESGCVFTAHHETLMLEKFVRTVQSIGKVQDEL